MNEIVRTVLFVALGAALLLAAWVARPAAPVREAVSDAGERFFTVFDSLDAASLEIVQLDETASAPRLFKVARVEGVWSIPSHADYPADAKDQMAEVAAAVVDLQKGPTVSDLPADHDLYGVVDPLGAAAGAAGVGTRVTLAAADGKALADIIIGKKVRGDQEDLHFVRLPQYDRVYTTKVSTGKLSTKFEDWIERDLLQLNSWDIVDVAIDSYSIDEIQGLKVQGDVLELAYDTKSAKWALEGLGEGEELVPARLNDLRRALDDLEIVDVRRKPPGLGAELRAEDQLLLDAEAVGSLRSRGFYITRDGHLLSNEGETVIGTKDGVQYRLRFGEIAVGTGRGGQVGDAEEDEAEGEAESAEAEADSAANRFLFVTAELNEDLVEKPEPATMPEIPAAILDSAEDQEEAAEAETGDEEAGGDGKPTVREALDQARAKIEEDNRKKLEDHQKKLDEGRKKVRDLNARFADWYYVIPDDVYRKIRLKRADIVTAKAAPEKGAGGEDDAG